MWPMSFHVEVEHQQFLRFLACMDLYFHLSDREIKHLSIHNLTIPAGLITTRHRMNPDHCSDKINNPIGQVLWKIHWIPLTNSKKIQHKMF